jgi:hypothetical protein
LKQIIVIPGRLSFAISSIGELGREFSINEFQTFVEDLDDAVTGKLKSSKSVLSSKRWSKALNT